MAAVMLKAPSRRLSEAQSQNDSTVSDAERALADPVRRGGEVAALDHRFDVVSQVAIAGCADGGGGAPHHRSHVMVRSATTPRRLNGRAVEERRSSGHGGLIMATAWLAMCCTGHRQDYLLQFAN
jgi:hypothetical protein